MSVSLNDVITHLGPCYETANVSTIAFRQGNKYVNVATCIRFSENEYAEPANVDNEPLTEDLIIIKTIIPVQDGWAAIKQMFEKSQFTFNNINIEIDPKIKLMNIFEPNKPTFFGSISIFSELNWPTITFTANPTASAPDINEIDRACRKLGFADLKDCIKSELGLTYSPSNCPFVHFISPIYSKLDSVSISKEGITTVEVMCHKAIQPSMVLNAQFLKDVEKLIQHEKLHIPENNKLFEKHTLKLKAVNLNETDAAFRLILIHKGIGERVADERKLLKELIVGSGIIMPPLFSALSMFMSKQKLLDGLTKLNFPSNASAKKSKPEHAFEDYICKLLSVGGLAAVWLTGCDAIAEESGYQSGAADILSYDEKEATLLVIDCKTSLPDKPTIDKIRNTSKLIEKAIENQNIRVLPIIFTSKDASAQIKEAQKHGVTIIDPPKIEKLMELAQTGHITSENIKN